MPTVSQGQTPADKAIAKAKATFHWTVGMCDNFVANMYGYSSSGYATAVANWNATPANLKHPQDYAAPAGALMFWGGGDGHVALSLGNGTIVSTDINGPGTVSTAQASLITQRWGKPYLGWAYPYFQGKEATSVLGPVTGTTTVSNADATQASDLSSLNPSNIASGFVNALLAPFMVFVSTIIWGIETIAGMALMGLGVYVIVRQKVNG